MFFHGGFPGLAVGDWLLPPEETGTGRRLSRYPEEAGWCARLDVVYLSVHQQQARVFAGLYPDGAVYRVEPEPGVVPVQDPDAPLGCAVMVPRARVVEVVRARVVGAHRTVESWLVMLRECPGGHPPTRVGGQHHPFDSVEAPSTRA